MFHLFMMNTMCNRYKLSMTVFLNQVNLFMTESFHQDVPNYQTSHERSLKREKVNELN